MKYIFLFLATTVAFAACRKKWDETQPTLEKISESVYASGSVKSKNQYQVYATATGLLQTILVKEGDLVKKGDPLMIIQHETPRLNAENAQLNADFAGKNLQGERLDDLKTAIETARSKMLSDSTLLERQRGLWAQQIGSKVELEQRELAFVAAKNNYQSALLRFRDLQKQLRFAAEQSQKLLSISKNMEQDYTVRSQSDGRIYSILKNVGEIVGVQTPLAVIGNANDFIAELQVDENDIARIKTGQHIFLTLSSYKGQAFEGVVSRLEPIMNERTRSFTVEAEFVKQPPVLYPNLSLEANIVIQSKDRALTIPRAFLMEDSLVMLANKEKRKVKLGLKDYRKAEILEGLSASETILKPAK